MQNDTAPYPQMATSPDKDRRALAKRKGIPQGSPYPLLSNIIMLHELDKELEGKGHRFIRYADDFSIYTKSKSEARKVGNQIFTFLRDKLKLPINREKSGIRRPVQFTVLGFGFVPTYRKGEKGQYQLIVSAKSWKKLKQKSITRKTTMSFDENPEAKRIQKRMANNFASLAFTSNFRIDVLIAIGSDIAYGIIGRNLKGKGKI